MKLNKKIIQNEYPKRIIDVILSNTNREMIFAFCEDHFFLSLDAKNGNVTKLFNSGLKKSDIGTHISLSISDDDKYICLANDYDRFAFLFDLQEKKQILKTDRKDYHSEQTKFPVSFFETEGKQYLITAVDWNHIDIFDCEQKKYITKRDSNIHGSDMYLDYFYGELHVSPNKKFLLSSGWVWQPMSTLKFIDLKKWLNGNISEPEYYHPSDFVIMSYYWDRAVCWINDNTTAYLYDPREEGLDNDELKEMKLERDKSYILIYDVSESEIIKRIEFNGFDKNEYFEATPDCRLFYNKYLFISSEKYGIIVLDPGNEKIILKEEKFVLDKFSKKYSLLYKLSDINRIEIISFEDENS